MTNETPSHTTECHVSDGSTWGGKYVCINPPYSAHIPSAFFHLLILYKEL